MNIRKKQYRWYLKLKFLDLVWFGNLSGEGMPPPPPPAAPVATPLFWVEQSLINSLKFD